jgi:hypothetical protein
MPVAPGLLFSANMAAQHDSLVMGFEIEDWKQFA